MTSAAPVKRAATTLGEVLRRRMQELGKTPEVLADAVDVPVEYINDLISGRRRPPLPGRSDLYDRMTRFLKLARNDLSRCAQAERDATVRRRRRLDTRVRQLVLELCEPGTARSLEGSPTGIGAGVTGTPLNDLAQRLLTVAQGSVRRLIEDDVALRLVAAERGSTYVAMRLRVFDFLDSTADTLTAEDFLEFVRPRISMWDIDFSTDIMRIVLRAHEPRRHKPVRRGPERRPRPDA